MKSIRVELSHETNDHQDNISDSFAIIPAVEY